MALKADFAAAIGGEMLRSDCLHNHFVVAYGDYEMVPSPPRDSAVRRARPIGAEHLAISVMPPRPVLSANK